MINKTALKKSIVSLLLIFLASFLFVMSNPNSFNKNGFDKDGYNWFGFNKDKIKDRYSKFN